MASWPGFTVREQQTLMALAVSEAFQNNSLAVIEAGTGTGKTLAYLLPALISRKKTIVSTGLINLQEQIFQKDLPFIRRYFGGMFTTALLKGRTNYLCLRKLKSLMDKEKSLFARNKVQKALNALISWSESTIAGDRAEIEPLIKAQITWDRLSSSSDECLGQACRYHSDCFLTKARRAAQAADLVLVNHHLFMADLSLKGRGGQLLPEWEAAVFDEAHLLEGVATSHFGYSLSSRELIDLVREIMKAATLWECIAQYDDEIFNYQTQCDMLFTFFKDFDSLSELYQDEQPEWNDKFKKYLKSLRNTTLNLADLVLEADTRQNETDDLSVLQKRLEQTAGTMEFLAAHSDPNYVYQAESSHTNVTIQALPLEVGPYLTDLTQIDKTVIMTSATLSSSGSFRYFQKGLGLREDSRCLSLPSSYDYPGRTLLYVPKHLPEPSTWSRNFGDRVIPEIEKLLNITQGRALVLFTSLRNMTQAYNELQSRIQYPLLVQNQMGRSQLLAKFAGTINSVLLATMSFWQGVDVPGESLSAVIIDKLPFPRPDTPLVKAKNKLIDDRGGSSFREYSLPEATLSLKQGVGRLMRQETDQGLLVILDGRLHTKNYGRSIFKSLPPSPVTADIEQVSRFFANNMLNV
jgi:ATP-dependent DNA helicase DinG